MQKTSMTCPSCGAPTIVEEGNSKAKCSYCGLETILESKMVENLGEKVTSTFKDIGNDTQIELKRLQLTQELSMLQMQLSNLRAEQRSLQRENTKYSQYHLQQVSAEEKDLLARISSIQNALTPKAPISSTPPTSIPSVTAIPPTRKPNSVASFDQGESNKSWGTTLFLAIFLGLFGVHRYYTGHIGTGLIQTFTVGGFYIWWIIDIVSILSNNFKDSKGRILNRGIKANRLLMKIFGGIFLWFFIIVIVMANVKEPSGGFSAFLFFGLPIVIFILFNIKRILQRFIKQKS